MATKAILPQSTPTTNGHRPAGKVVPLLAGLADKVDHLAELRKLIHQAGTTERALTQEITQALTRAGLDRFQGRTALAVLGTRTTLRPDPRLFIEATGEAGWAALAVSTTAGRRFMGEEDLKAISETTTSPVLRLEAIEPSPAAA